MVGHPKSLETKYIKVNQKPRHIHLDNETSMAQRPRTEHSKTNSCCTRGQREVKTES